MKINENTNVAMPIKNMMAIIIAVALGIFAYTDITGSLQRGGRVYGSQKTAESRI